MGAQKVFTQVAVVIGFIAGVIAYDAYPNTGFTGALIALLGASWLLYRVSSRMGVWNFFGLLINPPMASLIAFFSAFIYLSALQEMALTNSLLGSFAAAVLGFAAGAFLFKYWNMG